ncbi:MAG: hypothetical protein RI637_03065, partial [Acidimicrobiia bacterium]|nr:hypothetical protein [Acidimicrobiia bacterium]
MRKRLPILAVLLVLTLIAAACAESAEETTTTAAPTTTEAPATTAAPGTTEAPMEFEGYVLDAGGCDYGGRVEKITAVDQYTVEFDLCGPHPAFLAQMAFGVFGIQPEEHLAATGGAPLDN